MAANPVDSELRLLRKTLDSLRTQLENFGNRGDVAEVSHQYNQVRARCSAHIDEDLLPPTARGDIKNDERVAQLLVYVKQLQVQMSVAARTLREASRSDAENRRSSEEEAAPVLGVRQRLWRALNQNLVSQIVGGLIVAAIVAVVGALLLAAGQAATQDSAVSPRATTSQEDGPSAAQAPLVTFADDSRAYVEFTISTRVLEEDAARVVAYGGDRETVESSLEAPTESAIHAILGTYTLEAAQQNRTELERQLLERLRPTYKAAGVTLDFVSLKGFNPLSD